MEPIFNFKHLECASHYSPASEFQSTALRGRKMKKKKNLLKYTQRNHLLLLTEIKCVCRKWNDSVNASQQE